MCIKVSNDLICEKADVSEKKHENPLYKRARANFITKALIMPLIDLNSPLKKSYWNTFYCAQVINEESELNINTLETEKKFTSKFCNNRWCIVCNRIRTAKLINGYSGELEKLEDKQFVTLTIRTVPEELLKSSIEFMTKCIRNIQKRLAKAKTPIVGIRKLEITHSEVRNDYHPHFHIIMSGKDRANLLREKWIDEVNKSNIFDCEWQSQDVKQAVKGSEMELFKYFTKLTSDSKKGKKVINPIALDTIFQNIVGKRVFQSMGIKKQVNEDITQNDLETQVVVRDDLNGLTEEEKADILECEKWEKDMKLADIREKTNYRKNWIWYQDLADWLDAEFNCLTGYSPSDKVLEYVSKISKVEKVVSLFDD